MFAQISVSRRLPPGLVILGALFGAVVCQSDPSCVTPDGSPGSCIARTACSHVTNLIQNAPRPLSAQNQRLFLNYRCDARAKPPKVCCPTPAVPPSMEGHRNLALLPKSCGDDEKIVSLLIGYGGNKTSLFEYTFMALIATEEDGYRRFTCAGTIINSRYVLTAAHCITNLGGKVLAGVRVGEHDYSKAIDCEDQICAPPVQDFLIEKIIIHKDFVKSRVGKLRIQHDIGLIRLRGTIDLTKPNVSPICLPTDRRRQEYNLEKRWLLLLGWGVTETENEGSPELLQFRVPLVSYLVCSSIYFRSIADGVSSQQLCAGGFRGIGTCRGDSGGPLLASIEEDRNTYVQYGIISVGATRCGQGGAPTIFTRVTSYMDWILDNLEP